MPIFALANAGGAIEMTTLYDLVALAVTAGLLLGKPIGIVTFSYVVVKAGVARLPTDVGCGSLIGTSCLAGVGFTMSLFIAGSALEGDFLTASKVDVLLGSILSVVLGLGLLLVFLPNQHSSKE